AMQVAVFALEHRMGPHIDDNVKIALGATVQSRLALACEANAIVLVDAGRNFHRQRLVALGAPGAAAVGAGIGNDLAGAVALRAGLLDGKETLRHPHLALAVAGGTGLGLGPRLSPGAMAGRALLHGRNADLGLGAARRFFQREFQVVAQIGAAVHAVAAAAPTGARVAEDLSENV